MAYTFQPGSLSAAAAAALTRLARDADRANRLAVAGPLAVTEAGGNKVIALDPAAAGPFAARVTAVVCPPPTTTPAPSYTTTTTTTTTSSTTPAPTTTTTPCPCLPCRYGFLELTPAACGNPAAGRRSADGTAAYALAADGDVFEVGDCVLVTAGGPGGWTILHGHPCPTTTPCPTDPSAGCPGRCRWEWDDPSDTWVRASTECGDGCDCPPPAVCLSADAGCGTAYTPCRSAGSTLPAATACFDPDDPGNVGIWYCCDFRPYGGDVFCHLVPRGEGHEGGGCEEFQLPGGGAVYCCPGADTSGAAGCELGCGGGLFPTTTAGPTTTPAPCRGRCVYDGGGRVVTSTCAEADCVCPVPLDYYCVKVAEGEFGCEAVPPGGTPTLTPCKGPFESEAACVAACDCDTAGWVEPPTTTTAAPKCDLTERACVRRPVTTTTTSTTSTTSTTTTSTTTPPPKYCVIPRCPPQTLFCVTAADLFLYDPYYYQVTGPVANCPGDCPVAPAVEYVWRCCPGDPLRQCRQFCKQDATCTQYSPDYETAEDCQAGCPGVAPTTTTTTTSTTTTSTTTTPAPTTTTPAPCPEGETQYLIGYDAGGNPVYGCCPCQPTIDLGTGLGTCECP